MKKIPAAAILVFASIAPCLAGTGPDLLRAALKESRAALEAGKY